MNQVCDTVTNHLQGMRGAGDSLGIAVRLYLRTKPMPEQVIWFEYDLEDLYGRPQAMAWTFVRVQQCVKNPRKAFPQSGQYGLNIRISEKQFLFQGYFYGKPDEYLALKECLQHGTYVLGVNN